MIKVEAVSYAYGRTEALRSIELVLDADRVALLGPNGAGKSTLIGLLTTVRELQTGTVEVAGHDLAHRDGRSAVRRLVGYVPQVMTLPSGWSCEELLAYACWLHGVTENHAAVAAALSQVSLTGQRDAKIKTLSGGMRQRLCVAQALVHRPQVLVVDEPTVGLDPLQRVRLREVLMSLDCQLVIATHLVDDVAAVASQVAILDGGSVVFAGTIKQLCGGEVNAVTVESGYLRHVADRERA